MALRIKYDISTAVSVGLAVGKDAKGVITEQEHVYLPGAVLPKNVLPRLKEALRNGDAHLNSIIEEVDGPDAPAQGVTDAIWDDVLSAPEGYNPFTKTIESRTQTVNEAVDYTDWKRADLDAELAKRNEAGHGIEPAGTGQGGNVKAEDIAAALAADDATFRQ